MVNQDLIEDFSNAALKGFGFDSTTDLYDVFDEFFKLECRFDNWLNFLYEKDGKFVGTGTTIIEDDFVFLANGSVLPDYRGHQIQQDLIKHRLAYGKSMGVKHAVVTTDLDSTSGRNLQRQGFQLAFVAEFYLYNLKPTNLDH